MTKQIQVSSIISVLEEYRDYYNLVNDGRQFAYQRAINSFRKLDCKIIKDTTFAKMELQYVGPSIRSKVATLIYGELPDSLVEIRKSKIELLNKQSKNPHKHYTHRDDVYNITKSIFEPFCVEHKVLWNILGSYRRLATYCGDADILITSSTDVSLELMDYLDNLVAADGTKLVTFTNKGSSKLKLVINETKFEIDVRFCNRSNMGSFMLHMTGSGFFNISMRQRAKEMGLSLSEYGILDKTTNVLTKYSSESDIFSRLGMDFIEPIDR